ncbi:MAG: hypothetical protein HS104_04980 [Polyangiaceae bacterium]|nr:hypothetical protein [Polyangiaceae bacterium]MCL4753748.1 hypothetical protein [Myxococcales bacterium]
MLRAVSAWLVVLVLGACSAEPAAPSFVPECNVNQFRACETEECRGAQQCVEPGLWDRCFCTVLDASYPKPKDADSDADGSADSAPE